MKRLKLNILSSKGHNAMSKKKNAGTKASMRTVWLAPALSFCVAAILLIFAIAHSGQAQITSTSAPQTAPDWLGKLMVGTLDVTTLVPANDPALVDPANSESATDDPPFLPRGGLYKLFGTGQSGADPQNPFNEVMKFDTTSGAIAGAFRILGDHVQVKMLTNQIELKFYFAGGKQCSGGSPRFQLGISGDGNGNFNQFPGGPDQNAFGYLGDTNGFQTGNCLADSNRWVHEDMTDTAPKWDLTQWVASGKPPTCTSGAFNCRWDEVVDYFQTQWPNHRVLNAVLVDDSSGFSATDAGCAYYDLVNTGARTYTNHQDASGSGTAPNSCP